MFKLTRSLIIASAVLFVSAPMVMAEPFINDSSTLADASFQQSFANFSKSLDNVASRMEKDTNYSNLSAAHRNLVDAQANQTDTWRTSQDAFRNTQEEMVLSGGAYNGNGSYGYFTGMGVGASNNNGWNNGAGSNITPDTWGTSGQGGSSVTMY